MISRRLHGSRVIIIYWITMDVGRNGGGIGGSQKPDSTHTIPHSGYQISPDEEEIEDDPVMCDCMCSCTKHHNPFFAIVSCRYCHRRIGKPCCAILIEKTKEWVCHVCVRRKVTNECLPPGYPDYHEERTRHQKDRSRSPPPNKQKQSE